MARGGGGPDSSGPGGMGADAFGGDGGGGGSNAGPSGRGGRSLGAIGAAARSGGPNLSMDGIATPAEMDAMDIMDDVDRAKAVRDALGAISAAQNQARDVGRAQAVRDAQTAINQARDVARANAVREAQRNIALAQAQQNVREAQALGLIGRSIASPVDIDKTLRSYAIQNVRETPVKTGMVMGPYKQDATPTALQNELGIPFGYSEFEGPVVEKETPSFPSDLSGLKAGPTLESDIDRARQVRSVKGTISAAETKSRNKNIQAMLDKEVIEREKELLDQMKELLDKGLMNLFSKEYGQLAKALRNLRQSQRYKISIGRKKGMKALQTVAGFALPVPGLGTIGPALQEKAIEMGFIDDTPLSEIEGMDFETDGGGGQVIIDKYPIS